MLHCPNETNTNHASIETKVFSPLNLRTQTQQKKKETTNNVIKIKVKL